VFLQHKIRQKNVKQLQFYEFWFRIIDENSYGYINKSFSGTE